MFDYVLSFTDQPTAQADPVVGKYWRAGNPGAWDSSRCFPGQQVWNPAQDVTTPQTINGQTVNVVTHTFLPGWFITIALAARDPALDSHPNLVLIADADEADKGVPPTQYLLYANEPVAQMDGLRIQPLPAGRKYFQ